MSNKFVQVVITLSQWSTTISTQSSVGKWLKHMCRYTCISQALTRRSHWPKDFGDTFNFSWWGKPCISRWEVPAPTTDRIPALVDSKIVSLAPTEYSIGGVTSLSTDFGGIFCPKVAETSTFWIGTPYSLTKLHRWVHYHQLNLLQDYPS